MAPHDVAPRRDQVSNEAVKRPASEVFGAVATALGWQFVETRVTGDGLVSVKLTGPSAFDGFEAVAANEETALSRLRDTARDVATVRLKNQRAEVEKNLEKARRYTATIEAAEAALADI